MDRVVVTIIGVTIIVLGGAIWLGNRTAKPSVTTATDDPNRPIATVSETVFEFGTMSVSEERERTVTITNTGQSDLTVGPASTSCDCTFARITMPNGNQSPDFSMHGKSGWSAELSAGEQANVTVIYKPSIMPVQGHVERSVLIQTNDPVSPSIQLSFTAEVE